MGWTALVGRIATVDEDRLAEALAETPVMGCHLEAESDHEHRVTVYLGDDDPRHLDAVVEAMSAVARGRLEVRRVAGEDWLQSYREGLSAFPVGDRWWVDPHPDRPSPAPAGRVRLVIEPRQAFGSGSHESTRLLLLELEALHELAGLRVLDVGCGSGILAFAALRLGASRVIAVDIDPVSVWVARRAGEDQERATPVLWLIGSSKAMAGAEHDLILCNMLLEEFAPILSELEGLLAPRGRILLAGMLGEQRTEVEARLEAVGLRVDHRRHVGEWCSLAAVREGGG